MSAWSVKTRRAPSRQCRDARVNGHTTTARHDNECPPTRPPGNPPDHPHPNFSMSLMVMCTYGADTSSSVISITISPSDRGAAMRRAERYCDDILPLTRVVPPRIPAALIVTGGHPVSEQVTSTPSCNGSA